MTRQVHAISAHAPLARVATEWFGAEQAHRAFPVIDAQGACLGLLDREQLQHAAATVQSAGELFGNTGRPLLVALPGETCRTVAQRLATHDLQRLPVVADPVSRRLVGIVSRSDLVKPVASQLGDELQRERFLRWKPRG
jgi:CBS-domain-containing membrane protein